MLRGAKCVVAIFFVGELYEYRAVVVFGCANEHYVIVFCWAINVLSSFKDGKSIEYLR